MTAIYYHPEAYSIEGPKLMGRNAAGESFLRGYLKYSKTKEFWIQVENIEHAKKYSELAKAFGRDEPVRVIQNNQISSLEHPGMIFYPGPGIGEFSWHRSIYGVDKWSLCGITHTTSSHRAMDSIVELITAPIHSWDALICTSTSVKDNVSKVLSAQIDYLKDRLGITRVNLPEMPVIPLGIHCNDFHFSPEKKQKVRSSLGIDEETIVILYMGRLSFHAKANPIPMYQALEKAANDCNKKVLLIECGWFANDYIRDAYREASVMLCKNIKVINLDGRSKENRDIAWAAADIFCSLSDNIQETFGITPIEAMAAGLPVVVSDWDGYKDTVTDGITGFRIPTMMPSAGLAKDLAYRYALDIDTYDMYCGYTCSLISVDTNQTIKAFVELFKSKDLREKMGKAGLKVAREKYDWAVIIPQYEQLWHGQAQIRAANNKSNSIRFPWPARLDPFYAFSHYASSHLTLETILSISNHYSDEPISRAISIKKLAMVNFADYVLPDHDQIKAIISKLNEGDKSVNDLIEGVDSDRRMYLFRSINWLYKAGIIKVS